MERDVKLFLGVIIIIFTAMFANSFLNYDDITGKAFFRSSSKPDLYVYSAKFFDTSITDPFSTVGKTSALVNENVNLVVILKSRWASISSFTNVIHKLVIKKDGVVVYQQNHASTQDLLSMYTGVTIKVPYTFTSTGNYCLDVTADVSNKVQESNEYNNVLLNSGCITVTCSNPNWQCSDWSPVTCPSSGTQSRTCTDLNNCGVTTGKPAESQSCTYTAPVLPDLVIDDVNFININDNQVITTPYAGNTVGIGTVMRNIGNAAASYYNGITLDGSITKDGVALYNSVLHTTVYTLNAGTSVLDRGFSLVLSAGNYCFNNFKIDARDNVVESNEVNNVFSSKCVQVIANPNPPTTTNTTTTNTTNTTI